MASEGVMNLYCILQMAVPALALLFFVRELRR